MNWSPLNPVKPSIQLPQILPSKNLTAETVPLTTATEVPEAPTEPASPSLPATEQTRVQAKPELLLARTIEQGQPVNAAALRAAFPQCEGLLDGEVTQMDIQSFSEQLTQLQNQLTPAELDETLKALSQAVLGSQGQVPELIRIMQQATPAPTLEDALTLATAEQSLQETKTHVQALLTKTLELMPAQINPGQASPAGCAAAYGKLAARQKDGLTQIDAEISRLDQQLAQVEDPAQQARLTEMRQQLQTARELLATSQQISQCLGKQAGVSKEYPIDIRIPDYAAINDLSSQQLTDLKDLGLQLRAQIAANAQADPELLKASAWTAQLAGTVGTSLSDPDFRAATRSMQLDTHPAAVALQYATQLKLVENGEARQAKLPMPHKDLGWYHPKFGTSCQDFIQVRLNGPKNMEILRSYVDTQLNALAVLSADELRAGKGEQLRGEIRANLKARLISDRSIESFMQEVDSKLSEVKSAQPELRLKEIKVPDGQPIRSNEMAAFHKIYSGLIETQLKASKDPMVQKYAKALELIQLKPEAGDAARYQENALAEAQQLIAECQDHPALKKIFADAKAMALELMFDPAIAAKGKDANPSVFDLLPHPGRADKAEARIKQLMTFIEGAAAQGVDPSEQLALLQALAPEQVKPLTERILRQDALEQIAAKAMADPSLSPAIANKLRELLGQAAEGAGQTELKLALARIPDAEVISLCKDLKEKGTDPADALLKTIKKYFKEPEGKDLKFAEQVVKFAQNGRVGGSLSVAGAILGLAGEGLPVNLSKGLEDGAAFTAALGETFLSERTLKNPQVKAWLGKVGVLENTSKLIGLCNKASWDFKDYAALTEGFAGMGKASLEVAGEWQRLNNGLLHLEDTKIMGKMGGFYKALGKTAALASVVLDVKSAVDANRRKDYVGQATSVIKAGAGTAGFVATCTGSGPLGWAALAVYGTAMGLDAAFGMSEEAEKVMDLRADTGLTQAMEARYQAVGTFYNGRTAEELPHAGILANIQAKPVAERNAYRAAVIHVKLEEALTSDQDEVLIKKLIDQAYGEGSEVFTDLINQLGSRMLGYVSEKNDYLLDIFDKMVQTGCSMDADSKFNHLLLGLAENHNNEVLSQVLTDLKQKHPAQAARIPVETLTGICDKLMQGQTDGAEEKAIYRLLADFATDQQFGDLIKSDEVPRFFKDLSSELSSGQTAALLVRALEADCRDNQSIRTAQHLYRMADFGVGEHNESLRASVETTLTSRRSTQPKEAAALIQQFTGWIQARQGSDWQVFQDQVVSAFTQTPVQGILNEADEKQDYQRYQNLEKLKANKGVAMAGVRQQQATEAVHQLSQLEVADLKADPRRAEKLLLTLLKYQADSHGPTDARLNSQMAAQINRVQLILNTPDLSALRAQARASNQLESQTYDQFVAHASGRSLQDVYKQLQADPVLQAFLQRAW